jgi:hypothetical protein
MPLAFRCARTGMLYPSDYVEKWGQKYGIGLGPEPISEALTNQYLMPIANGKDSAHTMRPVGVCRAQVDLVTVTQEEFDSNKAVLAVEDTDMSQRATIMRKRQIAHDTKMQERFPDEVEAAPVG